MDNTWWTPDSWAPDAHRVYLYTDRPIYRPGQTVHYNAIVRCHRRRVRSPPAADAAVTVTLYDARNNTVAAQSSTLDGLGAVHGAFALADEPPLGTYRLELDIAGTAPPRRWTWPRTPSRSTPWR
ncbi:MAG: MG2 domain-containing protein [Caldilineaceae bacterium]